MKKPTTITFAASLALAISAGAETIVDVIPFQGQLSNQAGAPLSPSNAVTVVFRLYGQPVGGVAIWEESQPNIAVNAGRFSVLLGSRTELPAAPSFNTTLYLGITVDDGNPATVDVEMRPRQALVPVISASYAKQAADADKLNGYDWSALFGANNPNGTILGARISAGTITSNQIASQAITGDRLAPATVTAAQIAPAAITRSQLANGVIDITALVQQVAEALCPPGSIMPFGGSFIPDGWLLCDGRAFTSAQYPRLWTAIMTSWGGSVSQGIFNVPDLRGLFLRGVDNSSTGGTAGQDPDVLSRTPIKPGGNLGNAVGSFQPDQFARHNHEVPIHHLPGDVNGHPYPGNGPFIKNEPTTSVGGNETRPKNAYVNYIIKY